METFVELRAVITDFQAKMAIARGEMEKTSRAGSSNFGSLSKGIQVAGAAVAAGAIAIGVESVKAASTFQSSMELIHTNAGVAQSQIAGLENQVLSLAGPTATAPDALADALYHLESNGLRGAQAMDALKVSAEGAKVGHADLTDVTNALGAMIASNIPGVTNYTQAMGVLNATVGAGDMHMQDLAEAFSTGLLASVKGFGVSIQDVGGALATFGDNNIRGAQAGTELRMTVEALAKPAKTGAAALHEIGLSQDTLAKDMQTGGLSKALNDLQAHLKANGDTGVKSGAILTEAFGKKAGVGIQVLENQVGRFNSKVGEVSKGAGSFGDAWKQTQGTFSFQMDQMKQTVDALGIKLGLVLIPVIEKVAKVVSGLVVWFQKHKQVALDLGIALGVLAGALVVAAVAAFIVANALTLGIGLAIAALVVGIVYLATHWKQVWSDIKQWFDDAVQFLRGGFGTLILAIMGPVGALIFVALHWQQIWGDIKAWTLDAVNAVVGFFVRMGHDIKAWTLDAVNAVVGFFVRMGHDIKAWTLDAVNGVVGFFVRMGHDIKAWTLDAVNGVVGFFTRMWTDVTGWARRIWGDVAGFFTNMYNSVTGTVSHAVGDVVNYFTNLPGRVLRGLGNIGGAIAGAFSGLPADVWNNVIMPLWNIFVGLPDAIIRLFEGMGSKITAAIKRDIPGGGLIAKGLSVVGLAEGGLVTKPTLAVVGEAGPELVIPVSTLGGAAMDASGLTRGVTATGAGSVGGGGGDLVIYLFPGSAEFGRAAGPAIRQWMNTTPGRNAVRIIAG